MKGLHSFSHFVQSLHIRYLLKLVISISCNDLIKLANELCVHLVSKNLLLCAFLVFSLIYEVVNVVVNASLTVTVCVIFQVLAVAHL